MTDPSLIAYERFKALEDAALAKTDEEDEFDESALRTAWQAQAEWYQTPATTVQGLARKVLHNLSEQWTSQVDPQAQRIVLTGCWLEDAAALGVTSDVCRFLGLPQFKIIKPVEQENKR